MMTDMQGAGDEFTQSLHNTVQRTRQVTDTAFIGQWRSQRQTLTRARAPPPPPPASGNTHTASSWGPIAGARHISPLPTLIPDAIRSYYMQPPHAYPPQKKSWHTRYYPPPQCPSCCSHSPAPYPCIASPARKARAIRRILHPTVACPNPQPQSITPHCSCQPPYYPIPDAVNQINHLGIITHASTCPCTDACCPHGRPPVARPLMHVLNQITPIAELPTMTALQTKLDAMHWQLQYALENLQPLSCLSSLAALSSLASAAIIPPASQWPSQQPAYQLVPKANTGPAAGGASVEAAAGQLPRHSGPDPTFYPANGPDLQQSPLFPGLEVWDSGNVEQSLDVGQSVDLGQGLKLGQGQDMGQSVDLGLGMVGRREGRPDLGQPTLNYSTERPVQSSCASSALDSRADSQGTPTLQPSRPEPAAPLVSPGRAAHRQHDPNTLWVAAGSHSAHPGTPRTSLPAFPSMSSPSYANLARASSPYRWSAEPPMPAPWPGSQQEQGLPASPPPAGGATFLTHMRHLFDRADSAHTDGTNSTDTTVQFHSGSDASGSIQPERGVVIQPFDDSARRLGAPWAGTSASSLGRRNVPHRDGRESAVPPLGSVPAASGPEVAGATSWLTGSPALARHAAAAPSLADELQLSMTAGHITMARPVSCGSGGDSQPGGDLGSPFATITPGKLGQEEEVAGQPHAEDEIIRSGSPQRSTSDGPGRPGPGTMGLFGLSRGGSFSDTAGVVHGQQPTGKDPDTTELVSSALPFPNAPISTTAMPHTSTGLAGLPTLKGQVPRLLKHQAFEHSNTSTFIPDPSAAATNSQTTVSRPDFATTSANITTSTSGLPIPAAPRDADSTPSNPNTLSSAAAPEAMEPPASIGVARQASTASVTQRTPTSPTCGMQLSPTSPMSAIKRTETDIHTMSMISEDGMVHMASSATIMLPSSHAHTLAMASTSSMASTGVGTPHETHQGQWSDSPSIMPTDDEGVLMGTVDATSSTAFPTLHPSLLLMKSADSTTTAAVPPPPELRIEYSSQDLAFVTFGLSTASFEPAPSDIAALPTAPTTSAAAAISIHTSAHLVLTIQSNTEHPGETDEGVLMGTVDPQSITSFPTLDPALLRQSTNSQTLDSMSSPNATNTPLSELPPPILAGGNNVNSSLPVVYQPVHEPTVDLHSHSLAFDEGVLFGTVDPQSVTPFPTLDPALLKQAFDSQ